MYLKATYNHKQTLMPTSKNYVWLNEGLDSRIQHLKKVMNQIDFFLHSIEGEKTGKTIWIEMGSVSKKLKFGPPINVAGVDSFVQQVYIYKKE